MKNFTTMVGWLLLVAVLAVPSFLFYNWLSKSKLQNQAELVNEPVAGSVFPSEKRSQPAGVQQVSAAPSRQVSLQTAGGQAAAHPRQALKADEPEQVPDLVSKLAPGAQSEPVKTGEPVEQPPSASANPPAAAPRPAQQPHPQSRRQPSRRREHDLARACAPAAGRAAP